MKSISFIIPMHIPEDGMAFSYQDIVESTYRNQKTFLIIRGDKVVQKVPVLGEYIPDEYDVRLFGAKGYLYEFVDKVREYTALPDNFWTCGCKRNFIHHKAVFDCEKCGKTQGEVERLPYLSDIYDFKWEFIVGG